MDEISGTELSQFLRNQGRFGIITRSVRSFRPEFRVESFRPSWGESFRPCFISGSFLPDFRAVLFRPDVFILGKRVR